MARFTSITLRSCNVAGVDRLAIDLSALLFGPQPGIAR